MNPCTEIDSVENNIKKDEKNHRDHRGKDKNSLCSQEKEFPLDVGNHRIDFLVEGEVIIELKATEGVSKIYEAQFLTYLRATEKRVGLLLNFNVERLKDGIKRMVL